MSTDQPAATPLTPAELDGIEALPVAWMCMGSIYLYEQDAITAKHYHGGAYPIVQLYAAPALLASARREARLREAAQLVWDTVPATFTGPELVKHSNALNALGTLLRDNIAKEIDHG